MHVGLGNLDEAQAHDRVDANRMHFGALAHHLPVDLAVGRDVDDGIAVDLRRAAEPAARGEPRPLLVVAPLDRPEFREMLDPGVHPVLGELAHALHNLAAPADAPPAAHRVEIHSERPRSIEDRCADGEPAPPSRRGEDDSRLVDLRFAGSRGVSHGGGADRWCAGPALRRCRVGAVHGTSRSTAGNPDRVPS